MTSFHPLSSHLSPEIFSGINPQEIRDAAQNAKTSADQFVEPAEVQSLADAVIGLAEALSALADEVEGCRGK
jgi:hypothetical protein